MTIQEIILIGCVIAIMLGMERLTQKFKQQAGYWMVMLLLLGGMGGYLLYTYDGNSGQRNLLLLFAVMILMRARKLYLVLKANAKQAA